MNAASVLLDNGLISLKAVAGDQITLSSGVFTGVVSSVAFQDDYMQGGQNTQHAISVALRTADLFLAGVPVPVVGDILSYGSNVYQVVRSDIEASGISLTCSEVTV